MAKLREYQTLEVKSRYFDLQTEISTPAEFDKFWLEIEGLEEECRYRGASEAKYMMYSSAQRMWIEREIQSLGTDYKTFIKRLIDEAANWNNQTINNFFKTMDLSLLHPLAYLSYMQHFGVPTTLLDFSESPFMALFFMVEGISQWGTDNKIEHYASFYAVKKQNGELAELFDYYYSEEEESAEDEAKLFERLFQLPFQMIFDREYYKGLLTNSRIVNQDGCFCQNNSPDRPLEQQYYDSLPNLQQLVRKDQKIDLFQDLGYSRKLARCWNINKNLKPYILKKLREEKGITRDFVYPDNSKLPTATLNAVLEA